VQEDLAGLFSFYQDEQRSRLSFDSGADGAGEIRVGRTVPNADGTYGRTSTTVGLGGRIRTKQSKCSSE
jgi:hypothetical protein